MSKVIVEGCLGFGTYMKNTEKNTSFQFGGKKKRGHGHGG